MTGGSSATSAPGPASCAKDSADSASCGAGSTTRSCSPATAAPPGSASTRSRRSRSTITCPARPCCRSAPRAATSACRFCQNWDISKSREIDTLSGAASPAALAEAAARLGLPLGRVHLQRPGDLHGVRDGRRGRLSGPGHPSDRGERGLHERCAAREFYQHIDAANIDLKGFTDTFYEKVTFAKLGPVLDTLSYLRHETDVWFEITTLLIPGHNDSDAGDCGELSPGSPSTSALTCRCTSPRSTRTSRCATCRARRRPP